MLACKLTMKLREDVLNKLQGVTLDSVHDRWAFYGHSVCTSVYIDMYRYMHTYIQTLADIIFHIRKTLCFSQFLL